MSTLFHLDIDFTGKSITLRAEMPADSHYLGVAPIKWRRQRRVPFGDLTGFGADIIEGEMDLAVSRLLRELRGAWEQEPLF